MTHTLNRPLEESGDIGAEIWAARRNMRNHLMTGLVSRASSREPMNAAHVFAEVPDWQLRQWVELLRRAAEAIEPQGMRPDSGPNIEGRSK